MSFIQCSPVTFLLPFSFPFVCLQTRARTRFSKVGRETSVEFSFGFLGLSFIEEPRRKRNERKGNEGLCVCILCISMYNMYTRARFPSGKGVRPYRKTQFFFLSFFLSFILSLPLNYKARKKRLVAQRSIASISRTNCSPLGNVQRKTVEKYIGG